MSFKEFIKSYVWRFCGIANINQQQHELLSCVNNLARIQSEVYQSIRFHDSIIDSQWLKYKNFTLGGWAADYGLMYTLFRTLDAMKPMNILEFGLGQTSKMIHQYAFYYDAKATTCEHDSQWVDFFTKSINGDYPVNIQMMSLQTINYKGYSTLTYEGYIESFLNRKFNLIVVDGPFGSEHYSRSQIIELARNNLDSQFCIIIDDCERMGEKDTITEVQNVLYSNGISFCSRIYSAEKEHVLICSSDLKFLTTL